MLAIDPSGGAAGCRSLDTQVGTTPNKAKIRERDAPPARPAHPRASMNSTTSSCKDNKG